MIGDLSSEVHRPSSASPPLRRGNDPQGLPGLPCIKAGD